MWTTEKIQVNPSAISGLITKYIQKKDHQLVLFGIQGGDGDNCQTGPLVAERLGWPCIREVTRVIRTPAPDCMKVFSRINGATLVQTVHLPLVLTIGHSLDSPCLRFPNLKQKLTAKKRQVTLLSNHELGIDDSTLINKGKTLVELAKPRTNKSCVFLEDKTHQKQAQHLYDKYLKGRLNL